jgi:RecA-family ATPase
MSSKSIGASAPKAFFRKSAFSLPEINKAEQFSNELVEGLFTFPSTAMLYGKSNSGKTFYAIDIAMSVATGIATLGMKTSTNDVGCNVLYLAAESPSGVELRIRTWLSGNRNRYLINGGDCHVVGDAIDLYSGNSTESIELTIESINKDNRLADGTTNDVRLVVIDTLAKSSGKADENSSNMATIMANAERIATNKNCVVLIIHHSGKDESAGARGHTSVTGAVDTVIHCEAFAGGTKCFIEKQRDLDTKGKEYAYKLESVEIGVNQWGSKRTSCFIAPCDLPKKVNGLSENDRKIIAAIRAAGVGLKRSEIADAANMNVDNMNKRIRILLKAGVLEESPTGSKIFVKSEDGEVV